MKFLGLLIALLLATPAYSTTIACDGKSMASDSQATTGTTKQLHFQKLYRINGFIVGCAGDVEAIKQFRKWFGDQKRPKPKFKEHFDALVFNQFGCFKYDETLQKSLVKTPCAIGTGGCFAEMSMRAGDSADKAVEYAEQIDLYSSGDIQVMSLDASSYSEILFLNALPL